MWCRHVVAVFGFLVRPISQTVFVEDDVMLMCTPGDRAPVNWYFKPLSSNETLMLVEEGAIFNNEHTAKVTLIDFLERPGHLAEPQAYDLLISNVDFSYAGEYTCKQQDTEENSNATATLTVLPKPTSGNNRVSVIVIGLLFNGAPSHRQVSQCCCAKHKR